MKIAVLGATGSVGRQALRVIPELGLEVASLAAGHASPELLEAVRRHHPALVATPERPADDFIMALPPGVQSAWGPDALVEAALVAGAETVLVAVTGIHGLRPTLQALSAARRVALANKETLVAGGDIVMREARKGQIVPVDSEHAALFHLLNGAPLRPGERLWITGSGGALRDWPLERLVEATREDVLRHPTWTMGPKVTVDSATLANKGLEVIEAHHLFGAPYDAISVVIHPESIVHGLLEAPDGSFSAELAPTDMALPIARALALPNPAPAVAGRLVPSELPAVTFQPVDPDRYPFLNASFDVGRMGGIFPAVLNAANEEAVRLFLGGRIRFPDIYPLVIGTVEAAQRMGLGGAPSLEAILDADQWGHRVTRAAQEEGRFP